MPSPKTLAAARWIAPADGCTVFAGRERIFER
jgi:hypothetical protein